MERGQNAGGPQSEEALRLTSFKERYHNTDKTGALRSAVLLI